jgi:flagellar biosynthesis chaperone FliJ
LYNSQNKIKIGFSAQQLGIRHSFLHRHHTIIDHTENSEPENICPVLRFMVVKVRKSKKTG